MPGLVVWQIPRLEAVDFADPTRHVKDALKGCPGGRGRSPRDHHVFRRFGRTTGPAKSRRAAPYRSVISEPPIRCGLVSVSVVACSTRRQRAACRACGVGKTASHRRRSDSVSSRGRSASAGRMNGATRRSGEQVALVSLASARTLAEVAHLESIAARQLQRASPPSLRCCRFDREALDGGLFTVGFGQVQRRSPFAGGAAALPRRAPL
jgi:hypothetical protein